MSISINFTFFGKVSWSYWKLWLIVV